MPAVGLVARADIFGLGNVGVVLDGDLVVVVEDDEVPEPVMARERGHLVADALFDIAIGDEAVDVVVEQAGARLGVRVEQPALTAGGHRHADRVADALAERARGGLHTGGQPVLRMPGRNAAPGAVSLEVIQRQSVPGQVQLDVQGEAGVPAGKHEAVAARPVWVGRVVPQQTLEEQVGRWREAHRGAGVP